MFNKLGKKVRSFVGPRWAMPIRYFFILSLLVAIAVPAVAYAAPTPADPMYVSFDGSGTIGGVTFADDDILKFDGTTWSMHFDGSDLGMLAGVDITAFAFLDDDTALFAFDEASPLGGVGGVTYTTNDIVRFDATSWGTVTSGTLSLFMTGSTVGLDVPADSIDALSILPDGSLLISTTGNPVVPGVSAADEDILKFTPTNQGNYTSGTWSLYFDASDVGLDGATEDIAALDVAGNVFHLATEGTFDVTTVSGTNQDIFTCTATATGTNTACTYDPALYFDGDSTVLLTVQLDAFSLERAAVDPSLTSFTRQSPATSPTNADSLVFRATFNEAVMNVDAADFAVTGTTATVTNVATISASVYDVTVSGGNLANLNGVVGLNLSGSQNISDLDANLLPTSEPSIDQTYTVQNSVVSSGPDTTGVFRPSNGLLYLKHQNTTGFADVEINYGIGGDYPVVGDWDGNGTVTIGVYRNGQFFLRNANTIGFADIVFPFGAPGDQPVAGDWDGDGITTIGVYRNGTFFLRNSNSAGTPDAIFGLGIPGDVGIAGDWNGDGMDTTGVFRPSNGALYLKNQNTTGFADIQINYGIGGDKPVTGDWNDDGIDTIGVYRDGQFYLRNTNDIGFADIVFALGIPGDHPIAGNWDGLP